MCLFSNRKEEGLGFRNVGHDLIIEKPVDIRITNVDDTDGRFLTGRKSGKNEFCVRYVQCKLAT